MKTIIQSLAIDFFKKLYPDVTLDDITYEIVDDEINVSHMNKFVYSMSLSELKEDFKDEIRDEMLEKILNK